MQTRVLVIGLDGATFKTLGPWLANAELPFISKLAKNGCVGKLRTFFPTLSPLEWSCFYTGKNPGKLGVFALSHVEDLKNISKVKILNATDIGSWSLWGILSQANKRVGVMNIAATYPPEPVNGFLISGLLTPKSSSDYYYPYEVGRFLVDYQIDLEFDEIGPLPDKNVDKLHLLGELYKINANRTATILALLDEYDLDFFIVNFSEIDQMQHLYWGDTEIMLNFYKFVDENIEKIYRRFSPSHTFFMSDHGFHQAESRYFYINTWLEKRGYLRRRVCLREKLFSWLYPLAIRVSRKSSIMRDLVPESMKRKVVGEYARYQIDFARSKVYASMWGIFISEWMRGFEYEAFRRNLKAELEDATDPATAEKVFKCVSNRENLFSGPDISCFPDLIPVPEPKYLINPVLSTIISEPCVHKPYLAGSHKSDRQGIFIAHGSDIRRAERIEGATIVDLAPTILHLFKIPIPADMDGRVLYEILNPESEPAMRKTRLRWPEEKDGQEYDFSEEEQAEIEKKLKALGYI